MLVAHNPLCKLPMDERQQPPGQQQHHHHQQQCAPLPLTMRSNLETRAQLNQVVVKQEPDDEDETLGKPQRSVIKPICLGGGIAGMYSTDGDSLNTPVVAASTPAATPNVSSLIFTYPSMLEPESPSPSSESCSKAHRRSSSSGDQSSDSLNSPTLLALWRSGSAQLWSKRCGWRLTWGPTAPHPIMRVTPIHLWLLKTLESVQERRPSWPCCESFRPLQGDPQGLCHVYLLFQCELFKFVPVCAPLP